MLKTNPNNFYSKEKRFTFIDFVYLDNFDTFSLMYIVTQQIYRHTSLFVNQGKRACYFDDKNILENKAVE